MKHSQTLPKIPTLAAVDWLLMRYASVTSYKNKKLLEIPNSYYIPMDLKFYVEQFFTKVLTS